MTTKKNSGDRPVARSRLGDTKERLDRKKRQEKRHAADGVSNGVVEIPGPFSPEMDREIRNIAARVLERERSRDALAEIQAITAFQRGLALETSTEKLAQHIADALARSRQARVTRTFDDEGQRRILTCHLPKAQR